MYADRSRRPEEHLVARGYTASKDQLNKRLARIEGQIRGISKMVDEDRYCTDILAQINAARAALDKVALGILDSHARHCLIGEGGGPTDPHEQVDELMTAVGRMLSR
jgi:DNA-binding FrmR family transcriptional regulator